MKIYYIAVKKRNRNTAGVKAPADICTICSDLGFQELSMPQFPNEKNKIYQKLWLFVIGAWNWLKLKNTIEDGSIVFYQHPMYGTRLAEKMVPMIQKKKHVRFIVLIHDLESLRGGIAGVIQGATKTVSIADNALLKKFEVIISHNKYMSRYLIEQGFSADRLIDLEIFDYLTVNRKVKSEKGAKPSIAVAGNLALGKCSYIYKLFDNGNNAELEVNLYGINYQADKATNNMFYHGSFKPEELPEKLIGDFGLVWDGNSADTCAGNTGEYLKFNNPHKTSLYIASGIPVIVWSQAAIADFVLENGVGITVDSLSELESKIKGINKTEYQNMCERTAEIGERLRAGYYFRRAQERACNIVL